MNKPEVTESGLPISGLLRQAIAFVRDFAAFAGPRGVMASVLAVLAASFDGVGLLLLVPLLSLITASETGTGWMHEFLMQAFDMAGAQSRWRRSTFEPLVARLGKRAGAPTFATGRRVRRVLAHKAENGRSG
jgi:hypothetical protein